MISSSFTNMLYSRIVIKQQIPGAQMVRLIFTNKLLVDLFDYGGYRRSYDVMKHTDIG